MPRADARIKRLIVLADGTWQSLENKVPTNIVKIARSIKFESDDCIQQVIFYDPGVGTSSMLDRITGGGFGAMDTINRITGGGFGSGLDVNVLELYTFLASNYEDGDEIYMFGFSRGSFTVRSLAGLIHHSGLVRRNHLDFIIEAYHLYKRALPADDPAAVKFKEEHGNSVPVTLLACFDTVMSIGIPDGAGGFLLKPLKRLTEMSIAHHDVKLNPEIRNAIHILSIDEDRQVFAPTLMEHHPDVGPDQLTQLYFPGGHGGVGGGDEQEDPLSNFALNFLIDEIERRGLRLAMEKQKIDPGSYDIPPKQKKPSMLFRAIESITGHNIRQIHTVGECHPCVAERYRSQPGWRPLALDPIRDQLLAVKEKQGEKEKETVHKKAEEREQEERNEQAKEPDQEQEA